MKVYKCILHILFLCTIVFVIQACNKSEVSEDLITEDIMTIAESSPRNLEEFKVFAYNVQFLNTPDVAWWIPSPCENDGSCDTRASAIAAWIPTSYDALVFSEAFEHDPANILIQDLQAKGYIHSTTIVGSDDSGREKNGGVFIMSRYPITGVKEQVFNDCHSCGFLGIGCGADCKAWKGFKYAKIRKNGKNYHLIGTHLDAGEASGDRLARWRQMDQIKSFINSENIPGTEPLFIAGDLNVNGYSLDRVTMQNKLNSVTSYSLAGVSGGYTASLDQNPQTLLDYVMVSKDHRKPNSTIYFVGSYGNLSDHLPVISIFRFNYSQNPPLWTGNGGNNGGCTANHQCPSNHRCISGNCIPL